MRCSRGELLMGSRVELVVDASADQLRLTRIAAAGFAAEAGFTVDEIEELRLAIGEAGGLLVDLAPAEVRLRILFTADDDEVVVEARCAGRVDMPLVVDPVADAVLHLTVDRYELRRDRRGTNSVRLRKRPRWR